MADNEGREGIEVTKEMLQAEAELQALMAKGFTAFKKGAGDFADLIKTNEKLTEQQKEYFNEMIHQGVDSKKSFNELAKELEVTIDVTATLTHKVGKLGEALTSAFGGGIADVQEFITSMDEVPKAFSSATGITEDLSKSMALATAATRDSGVTMAEVGKSYEVLAKSMSGFIPSNLVMNQGIVEQISLLTKLGVSSESSALSLDFLNKSVGMTAAASMDLTREIAMAGDAIGITSDNMLADFRSVAGSFGIYGPRMVDTFKNLQAAAKASGMEISDLVGLADKFNTFDSAADSAGKLNAVLGTQLSTVNLMNMGHDERLNTLRDEIQRTVGDFTLLDKYTQQYIADAMGFKDVGEAGRFINMSVQDQEEYALKLATSAKSQKDLADATESFLPVMQKLQIALMSMVRESEPLITTIISFIEKTSAWITENKTLISVIGGLGIALGVVGKAIVFIAGVMEAAAAIKLAYTTATAAMSASQGVAAATTTGLAGSFTLLNVSMGVFGIAIAAIAFMFLTGVNDSFITMAMGVATLAVAFVALNHSSKKWTVIALLIATAFGIRINPLFVQAFGFMAIGVLALAVAFKFMGPQATLAALVLAVLFASVALLIYGLSDLLLSMKGLGTEIYTLVPGLYLLGLALMSIGLMFANPVVVAGLAVFSVAIGAIGLAIGAMGSGVDRMVSSLKNVKSIVADLQGTMQDSFIAITATGRTTSAVMANGAGLSALGSGNVKVDVSIPKMDMPKVSVKVFLDSSELRSIIKQVVAEAG